MFAKRSRSQGCSCNEALQQNDEHLQRRFGRDEASCRGRVFHVGLWGEQGALALRLHAGQFVRLGRVHVRAHTWQGLLGAMGSQSRQSDTITILDERDALLHREVLLARLKTIDGQMAVLKAQTGQVDQETLGKYSVCYDRKGRRKKRVDKTSAHRDHIHFGMNWPGANKRTTFWRGRR